MLGISIVTTFYLLTNLVLFGIRQSTLLAGDTAPLVSAIAAVPGPNAAIAALIAAIVGGGALISVAGSDESGMIGTSRLGYALTVDGLFPRAFAKVHPKYKTPYIGIIIQSMTAFAASVIGNLGNLVSTSVLFMAIAYFATSASISSLRKKKRGPKTSLGRGSIIPALGALFSLYLISQCTIEQIAVGVVLLFVGVAIYVKCTPKKEMTELKEALLSRQTVLEWAHRQEHTFLANPLRHLKRLYRRISQRK